MFLFFYLDVQCLNSHALIFGLHTRKLHRWLVFAKQVFCKLKAIRSFVHLFFKRNYERRFRRSKKLVMFVRGMLHLKPAVSVSV